MDVELQSRLLTLPYLRFDLAPDIKVRPDRADQARQSAVLVEPVDVQVQLSRSGHDLVRVVEREGTCCPR